jgi:signal transduction histidine kinase
MKIRNKLAILFALIVASLLLIFSFTVYLTSAKYRQQEFFSHLEERAFTIAGLLFDVNGVDTHLLQLFDKKNLTALYHEEITVYDAKNAIVYDSGKSPIQIDPTLFEKIRGASRVQLHQGETEVVGVLFNHLNQRYVVIASAVDITGKDKLQHLALVLFLGWSISIGVVIIVGWFFAGRALQPISEVVSQVDRITASKLNLRVQVGNTRDEIGQLALIFNRMLARLEEAFQVQKSFVAHASHEIRTPLTAVTGQIEVTLLQNRTSEEYRQVLSSILDDVRNITHLTNGLLELTQASADISTFQFKEFRIDELLWQARSELLKKQPDYQIKIDFDESIDEEFYYLLIGSEPLLRTAFLNLMENGCKFSGNHQVQVLLKVESDQLSVRLTDQGSGIPENDLPHIFEPFYRSESTRHIPGHGVGLALTRKIIQIHQGTIEVDSRPNQGTTFTVTLPHVNQLDHQLEQHLA